MMTYVTNHLPVLVSAYPENFSVPIIGTPEHILDATSGFLFQCS